MKFVCKCGNEFEDKNNINDIDIQWTKFNGCEICMAMLPVTEVVEPVEQPIDLKRKKTKF